MAQRVDGVALGSIAVGSLVLYAGITGRSIPAAMQSIIQGKTPAQLPNQYPVSQVVQGSQSSNVTPLTTTNSSAGPPVISGGGTKATNIALAQLMAAGRGWTGQEWNDLFALWDRESAGTWSPTVTNPTSGAYGIPQSLPANKMASAGSDWQTNPATQIKWGLDYIAGRYGSPSVAWQHELSNNWY